MARAALDVAVDVARPSAETLLPLLRAAADPLRLQVLRLLARDAWNVAELCQMLGVTQPALSHHLKLLADAGLVVGRRDGRSTYYRRGLMDADTPGAATLEALLAELDAAPVDSNLAVRRAAVFEARREASERFFARHADAFRASQDLIAQPERYLPDLQALMPARARRALDLGPGDGALLPDLAGRADSVVGIDTSEEMVAAAGRLCAERGLDNVILLNGDLERLQGCEAAADGPFDLIVCAMVLHHVPRPRDLFARCAASLASGGLMLLADLCPHEQDWVRDACGDVWLGFEPTEISAWAEHAGLVEGPAQYLAQPNGFRIQVRAFAAPLTHRHPNDIPDRTPSGQA